MVSLKEEAKRLTDAFHSEPWFQAIGIDETNKRLYIYLKQRLKKSQRPAIVSPYMIEWKFVGSIKLA